jgi:hypothetical protein
MQDRGQPLLQVQPEEARTNKLPYGTCSLRVHSTRIVQTIFGSIQGYGGFDRPEWLD